MENGLISFCCSDMTRQGSDVYFCIGLGAAVFVRNVTVVGRISKIEFISSHFVFKGTTAVPAARTAVSRLTGFLCIHGLVSVQKPAYIHCLIPLLALNSWGVLFFRDLGVTQNGIRIFVPAKLTLRSCFWGVFVF